MAGGDRTPEAGLCKVLFHNDLRSSFTVASDITWTIRYSFTVAEGPHSRWLVGWQEGIGPPKPDAVWRNGSGAGKPWTINHKP